MSDPPSAPPEPGRGPRGWIRENPVAASVGAGILLVVVVIAVVNSGGDDSPDEVTTSAPVTSTTSTPAAGLAGVPNVDCGELLTLDDIDEALGVAELPQSERSFFEFTRGERCSYQLGSDERVFVTIEPGSPSDLEPDAVLLGVAGARTSGVADAARWFGGPDSDGGGVTGTLSVGQQTPRGALLFRISVGRPELSADEQLDVAKTAALAALPRFPGVDEPEAFPIEREEIDRATVSFVDNILAKEADGEWSLEQGIEATLAAFAGEGATADVLRSGEVADASGTAVIQLARNHISDAAESETAAEIERLLDALVVTDEELGELLVGTEPVAIEAATSPTPLASVGAAVHTARPDVVLASRAAQTDECTPALPCMVEVVVPGLDEAYGDGKYRLFAPTEEDANGWTNAHLVLVVRAIQEAAARYEDMGTMPEAVRVTVWPFNGRASPALVSSLDADHCDVDLNLPLRAYADAGAEEQFKQWIAREMGYCLVAATFPTTVSEQAAFDPVPWWLHAFAIWLSTEVHDDANLEWEGLQAALASVELAVTVTERGGENWVYFEGLDHASTDAEMLSLVADLVASGPNGQDDVLSSVTNAENRYHEFVRDLTDKTFSDDGGGTVPYDPPADEFAISRPGFVDETVERFGAVRLHATVDAGKTACLDYETTGDFLVSWRAGAPGSGGSWSRDLPDTLSGEAVFIATATQNDAILTVLIGDVDEDPECEDEEQSTDPSDAELCGLECVTSEYFYELLESIADLLAD